MHSPVPSSHSNGTTTSSWINDAILNAASKSVELGVLVTDPEGRVQFCNPAFELFTGYRLAEIKGKTCYLLLGEKSSRETVEKLEQAVADGREFRGDLINYRKDGKPFLHHLVVTPCHDGEGSVIGFTIISTDVTAQRKLEAREKAKRAENQAIFDHVQCGLILYHRDRGIIRANPIAVRIFKIRANGPMGDLQPADWHYFDLYGARLPDAQLPLIDALESGKQQLKHIVGLAEGASEPVTWISCDAYPVSGMEDGDGYILLSFSDITDILRKDNEARLFRNRFETAAEASNDVIFDWDLLTYEMWVNHKYEMVFGHSQSPVVRLGEFAPPNMSSENRARLLEELLRSIARGDEKFAAEYEFLRPDGSTGYAVVKGVFVRNADGVATRLIGAVTDLTSYVSAVRAARQSEERFKLIAGLLSDVIWDLDLATLDLWLPADWADRIRVRYADTGTGLRKWVSRIHPDDRFRVPFSLRRAILAREPSWSAEFRMLDDRGRTIYASAKAIMVRGEDGTVERVVGSFINATREKRQQEGLSRSRALEAVGQLTGGVAHDFNNLLMIIIGNAELLEMSDLDPEDRESVALIRKAAQSGSALTARLLSFAGSKRLNPSNIDVANFLKDAWHLIRAGIPEKIAIESEIPDGLWPVAADSVELERSLLNLTGNAADAMPEGGELRIEVENRTVKQGDRLALQGLERGDYVAISIVDNGHGITEEDLGKVLEPFYSTKEVGQGTGLGLSAAYGFARKSGGTLTIQSEVGAGTAVTLLLPRSTVEAGAPSLPEDDKLHAGGGERILLVEDHEDVRAQVYRQLTRLGYEVVAVESGHAALALLEEDPAFDLVFSDVVMPGRLDGPTLAKRIAEHYPQIRVLLTSGYPDKALNDLAESEFRTLMLIKKPYKMNELSVTLRQALGAMEYS